MKRLLVVLACLSLVSCGGGGGSSSQPPANVTIAISPTSATVAAGTTQQFSASVSGTSNTAVTWQVNNTTGGNSTVGTITTAGLYTAPAIVPSPATVTVTAVSQADSTQSASATVTISLSVSVYPSSATVQLGLSQQFSASVSAANTAVTWEVNGTQGGNSTVGTITSDGLYTAPASVPAAAVAVTAVSQVDNTTAASAAVTVAPLGGYSNATLNGSYAFSLTGEDTNGFFLALGSFQADGQGNLLSGVEDLNDGTGVSQDISLSGYYSVDPDGRGVARLYNQNGYLDFSLVVLTSSHIKFMVFDTIAGGGGDVFKSDSTAFNASAISGYYSFGFDGFDTNNNPSTTVGTFTADGAGNITTGEEDISELGTVTSSLTLTGTYSLNSVTGRGTASFVTANDTRTFAFQVVSANTLLFMELEFSPAVVGTAYKQQLATFATSTLAGDYAFSMALPGVTNAQGRETATAGRFTANVGGISAGVLDDNNAGTITSNASFTGSYSIAPDGRGIGSFVTPAFTAPVPVVFYMVSATQAFIMSSDPAIVQSGQVLAQQGGPFTNASLSGGFGFRLVDSYDRIWTLGQITLDGIATISGTEDVNEVGTLSPDVALAGTYTVSSNGRGTATVTTNTTTSNLVFYVVSGSRVLAIEVDPTATAAGSIGKQM